MSTAHRRNLWPRSRNGMVRRNRLPAIDVCVYGVCKSTSPPGPGRIDMIGYRNNRSVGEIVKISTIDAIASFLGRYGLVVVKPLAPRLSIIGSLLAILLFLATISF